MLKFVGKALAGLVLTKEAQGVVGHIAKSKIAPFSPSFPFPNLDGDDLRGTARMADHPTVSADPAAAGVPAVDRATLIRDAMRIRAEKQGVLADLDEESRAKLVALAMRALLNEGPLKG